MNRNRYAAVLLLALAGCAAESASTSTSGPARSGPRVIEATSASGMGSMAALPDLPDLATVEDASASTIRFDDVTEGSGIDFRHRSGNSPEKFFPTANGSGVAMLDYDEDGRLDLYFATTRDLPMDLPSESRGNRLYRNLGDWKFEDVTERAGVGFNGFCHGLAVGDYNGDGHPDLFLANLGPNVLYLSRGDGTFRDASSGSGLDVPQWNSGAAPMDYDGDGLLDLYVTSYGQWTVADADRFCGDASKGVRTYCSPSLIRPDRHYLFRNRGDGTFEDASATAGVLRGDGRGLGVVAADLDGDALVDLYVANDLCPNFLFRNRGDGTFEDLTEVSGAARTESGFSQAGMGVDAEDLSGDGLPELFATNFRGDHNTLYRNLGGAVFQDVSAGAGIIPDSMPEVGWGCALADLDGDLEPDMIVVNGHVDDNLGALGQDAPHAQRAKVWRNLGRGRFRIVRDPGPFFDTPHVARGAAFGDLDDDGDLDAVVSLLDGRPALLRNESNPSQWIRLEFRGRSAIGGSVAVQLGDRTVVRQIKGGGSYLSSNDPRPLIGLGSADRVDRIEVRWPGGGRSELIEPTLGRTHLVSWPGPGASTADRERLE